MEAKEPEMTHPTRPTDLHRAAVDLATDVAAVLVDRAGSLPAEEAYRLGMEGVRIAERLLRASAADSAREAAEAYEAARVGAARIVVALDRLAALYPLPEEAAAVSRRAGRLAHAVASMRDEYRWTGEGA
jgi:RecA/RadA recombinase